jgi:hypothetical protein
LFPITRLWIASGWKTTLNIAFPELARAAKNYTWVRRKRGDLLLAYGRDPYFPGWPDTLQLNYGNPATQEAMIGELVKIAGQCDGVRYDVAMLVLPDVFERTWGAGFPNDEKSSTVKPQPNRRDSRKGAKAAKVGEK